MAKRRETTSGMMYLNTCPENRYPTSVRKGAVVEISCNSRTKVLSGLFCTPVQLQHMAHLSHFNVVLVCRVQTDDHLHQIFGAYGKLQITSSYNHPCVGEIPLSHFVRSELTGALR